MSILISLNDSFKHLVLSNQEPKMDVVDARL